MKIRSFSLLSACLFLSACSPDIATHLNPHSSDNAGIIGGTRVEERSSPAARSVVLIEMTNASGFPLGFCSATLIGRNTVLTAGHCFDKTRIPKLAGFNVVFTNDYQSFSKDERRKGKAHMVHPDYNSTKKFFDHDLAVAVFQGPLPKDYEPVAYDEDVNAKYAGDKVYVYGYGRSQDYSGKKTELTYLHIGQLHRGVMQIEGTYDRFPDRYWTNHQIPTFICQGDSGGPQFRHENGELKLIGVNSAVYGPELPNGLTSCKGIAQATKVAPFAEWIKSVRYTLTTEFSETFLEH
ncbi:S1 family peptidase [Bdellovibrio sp. 22V]|uniref:S1 family peptidase n=1 Tax=Bdellovibrio sp. 22V TaxID=3044166 RepID=UPI0025437E15|nr:S1 family peptidase [Bdellovibrio sp. 22V]WII71257.1 S1 family peptidase [Bdellovibrio sp. 22V]